MFFDALMRARDVLLDPVLRKIYDDAGEDGLEQHASEQERCELDETTFDDDSHHDVEWRQVEEGEVFGAGEYFWMDQSTGITYVAMRASVVSTPADRENDGNDIPFHITDLQIALPVNLKYKYIEQLRIPECFYRADAMWNGFFHLTLF